MGYFPIKAGVYPLMKATEWWPVLTATMVSVASKLLRMARKGFVWLNMLIYQ